VINLLVLLVSSKQLGGEIIGQVSLLLLNITIIQLINEVFTGYSLVHFIPTSSVKNIYKTGLMWTEGCILILNLFFFLLNIGIKELAVHVALLSFIGTLHSFHLVILLGKEKITNYNFLVFLQPTLLLVALCVNLFILKTKTLNSYLIALYVSFCVSFIMSLYSIIKLFIANPKAVMHSINTPAIFKNGFINQIGNLAHVLGGRYNFYLLSSTLLVGIFSRASSLIESAWVVSGSITPIILTHVANQKDISNNGRVTFLLAKVSFLLSVLCVLLILVLPASLFDYLLGNDFKDIKSLMLYLSPGILCISFSTVISHYFSGLGKQGVQLMANCLGLVATICLAPFLISRYQLIGACYATSISYCIQALVLTIAFMNQNKFNLKEFFRFKNELNLLKKDS
jgi:O-antigen/teichoic acid export membrane protein